MHTKNMKKIHEELVVFFESKILVRTLYCVGIFIILSLAFSTGMSVGFRKASFGRNWGENYERNFGMRPGSMMGLGRDSFPNSHGAVGKILKVELPTITVEDKDKTEKVVLVKKDTNIQEMRQELKAENLKIDDFVIIIGNPNPQGQIEAKFIRVMPHPELLNNTTTNEKPLQ